VGAALRRDGVRSGPGMLCSAHIAGAAAQTIATQGRCCKGHPFIRNSEQA